MKETIRKLLTLLPKGDLIKLSVLFAMMIAASLLALLGVGTVPVFVLAVVDSERVFQLPVLGELLQALNITTTNRLVGFGALFLMGIYAIKNVYMFFYDYLNTRFMLRRVVLLQNRLFKAYMNSPYLMFLTRNSSELIRNISSESNRAINQTLKPIMAIMLHSLMVVVIASALIYTEPLISGLGILLFGGFSVIFLKLTQKKMTWFGTQALRHRRSMMQAIIQGLGGFKDAKVLNRESFFLGVFGKHANQILRYELWNSILRSLPVRIIEMLALGGVLFIAVSMILQGRDPEIIVPTIALFGAAVMKLKPSIFQLIDQVNSIRFNKHSIEQVWLDLNRLENLYVQKKDEEEKFQLERVNGSASDQDKLLLEKEISLKDVTFVYPDSSLPAVKNISLSIEKNRAVAFVGESGAGKTTIVDVILGLLEPQQGTIEVDGQNVYRCTERWQKNIGYIPQEIYLLDDTIRRNICFGIPDDQIDEESLQTAIETAQLTELIKNLEKGDRTRVGERGVRLSGGQRQRIGIARALYHNPQVLVMDEATSALDNITEKYVIDAIERLKGEKTIIMIAHRLTTVENCDTIHLMKNARVIASGTYNELLLSSPEFREMSMVPESEDVVLS
jgi:ATP-binding cassette subfamily C protein